MVGKITAFHAHVASNNFSKCTRGQIFQYRFHRIEVRPYSYAGIPNFSLCAVDLQYNHKDVFTVVNLASDLTVHVAGNPLVNLKLTGLLGQLQL